MDKDKSIIQQIREAELDAIKQWIKPRTIFATLFYCTACYLILNEIEIPQVLNTIIATLLGFYFGQKIPQQIKSK